MNHELLYRDADGVWYQAKGDSLDVAVAIMNHVVKRAAEQAAQS